MIVYHSGILVLAFVGFCALLVVFQLMPAVMMLLEDTKKAWKSRNKPVKATNYK